MDSILYFTWGALATSCLAVVIHVLNELRWRDRLNSERLSSKDRETLARLEGSKEAAVNIIRDLRWPSSDEAAAAEK